MSEFQYVGFRAIDGTVTAENLEFMKKQSSRAEISAWAFDNEYNYGDFRGDAAEMLRRGYDFHIHYADYGIRKLMIRLPVGLPDPQALKPYFDDETLSLEHDKSGPGSILTIQPFLEPGDLDDCFDHHELFDRLLPLRNEILDGDLRPLYLLRMAGISDSDHDWNEEREGPVPAGLDQPTDAQRAVAEFYGLGDSFFAAAARGAPPMAAKEKGDVHYADWLKSQPESTRIDWLLRLMVDSQANVRREMLAEFRKSQNISTWPTANLSRTVSELLASAEKIDAEKQRQKSAAAAEKRAANLAAMAADPKPTLLETERLVTMRSTQSYAQIASLLANLREATAGSKHANLAERQARKLKDANPTLKTLTGALRKKGFVPK